MVTNSNITVVFNAVKKMIKTFPGSAVEKLSLKYNTPFHILIATILSARTKDETTFRVSQKLFQKIEDNSGLLKIPAKALEKIIYPTGFYRVKSKNLKKTALILRDKFNNKVPSNMNDLLLLPGVGRKTANLVLIRAFNKYGICVDTHVHRIVNRWQYVKTAHPDETELKLREILPKRFWKTINEMLVTFGKNICKPGRPLCHQCKITKYCPSFSKFY